LTQGETFLKMHADQHGGKRRRSRRAQRGGAAPYPADFSDMLPAALRTSAEAAPLDNAFAQLPQFVGKYGMSGGRRTRRAQRGGAGFGYTPGATNAPNYMILSPAEEPKAFLNPQWYTENMVVPTFQGPVNAMAQQSYNNQFKYGQGGGSRRRRSAMRRKSAQRKRRAQRKH
jgi:hypothetical protein